LDFALAPGSNSMGGSEDGCPLNLKRNDYVRRARWSRPVVFGVSARFVIFCTLLWTDHEHGDVLLDKCYSFAIRAS
jgi:hypothetical protein